MKIRLPICSCLSVLLFLVFPFYLFSQWKNSPQKIILDNGLTLIYQKDDSSAVTALYVLINGGQMVEPADRQGLAYLTTRLSVEIPDSGMVRELMIKSSRISTSSGGDYSLVNVMCLSEHLEDTVKILSRILKKPLFSGLRIDYIKKSMTHLRELRGDDAILVGHQILQHAFFGETHYGASLYGDNDSLKAIKGKDIRDFYDHFFVAHNLILSVSSDLEEAVITRLIRKYFSEFRMGKIPEPTSVISKRGFLPAKKEFFIEKKTRQYLISTGFPLPHVSPKNFVLASALENLLGKGPASRLWRLRSEQKLAYNPNAKSTQWKEAGILEAYLETDASKKSLALDALNQTLLDLYKKGITQEEWQNTKISTKAHFLRSYESKEQRTAALAIFEALGLGSEFLSGFFVELDALPFKEMNAYIKDVLDPEKAVVVIVGPKENSVHLQAPPVERHFP
ncbi:MAG: pitrilysin family protein [Candidatus Aminicenantales bacterium]